jgi:hypothetical protein
MFLWFYRNAIALKSIADAYTIVFQQINRTILNTEVIGFICMYLAGLTFGQKQDLPRSMDEH